LLEFEELIYSTLLTERDHHCFEIRPKTWFCTISWEIWVEG